MGMRLHVGLCLTEFMGGVRAIHKRGPQASIVHLYITPSGCTMLMTSTFLIGERCQSQIWLLLRGTLARSRAYDLGCFCACCYRVVAGSFADDRFGGAPVHPFCR